MSGSFQNIKNIFNEYICIYTGLTIPTKNIYEIWDGLDNNNFLSSFNKHVKNLDLVINFLGSNGTILKDCASEHGNIDKDFATQMERSGLEDEHQF